MKLAAALVLSALAGSAFADLPARVGRLSALEGEAVFAHEGADAARAVINTPITSGDSLRTGQSARAEIQFGSSTLFLSENSRLHFTAFNGEAVRVYLVEGGLVVRMRDAASFELSAPRLHISFPNAGLYRVDVENGASEISVREGLAEVTRSTGERFTLGRSQSARIAGVGERHTLSWSGARDRLDEWANARLKPEEDSVSAQYVSSEVTGYQELDSHGTWGETIEYGPVWIPHAAYSGWAPYRYGYWSNVHPWGRTWIDHQPWGFATFHYGRWVERHKVWCWVPGPFVKHPHFAPTLVKFPHEHKHHDAPKVWQPLPPEGNGVGYNAARGVKLDRAAAAHLPHVARQLHGAQGRRSEAVFGDDSRDRTRVESGRMVPENFGRMRPAIQPRAAFNPTPHSSSHTLAPVARGANAQRGMSIRNR